MHRVSFSSLPSSTTLAERACLRMGRVFVSFIIATWDGSTECHSFPVLVPSIQSASPKVDSMQIAEAAVEEKHEAKLTKNSPSIRNFALDPDVLI